MSSPARADHALITFEYNANADLRLRHRAPRRLLFRRQLPAGTDDSPATTRRRRSTRSRSSMDSARAPDQARHPTLARRWRDDVEHPPGHRRRRLRRACSPSRRVRPDGRHRGRDPFSPDGVDGVRVVVQLRPVRVGHPTRRPVTTTYNYPWATLEGVDGTRARCWRGPRPTPRAGCGPAPSATSRFNIDTPAPRFEAEDE